MFSLHVLGDPVLRGPDGPVRGRAAYKRRVALLAILAVARGRPVGRERLVGLLWPEQPADSARHVLSETLYVLRKELGEETFVAVGGEIALNPAHVASDVAAFQDAIGGGRLEDAVGVYGGPLLDGFYVAGALEFERWVDAERDRLARAFGRAVETLAERAEQEGSALAAADWWERLAAHDPYSSRVALRRVRALEAAGERAQALRAAESHAALLRADLEVEPDGELLDFVERLRAEPPRRATPPSRRPTLPPSEPEEDDEPCLAETRGLPSDASESGEDDSASQRDSALPPSPGPSPARGEERTATDERQRDGFDSRESDPRTQHSALRTQHSRFPRTLAHAGAMAGLVLGMAAALLPQREGGGSEPPRHDPRRIAVLYFDDHTPGGGLGYLASGLTEMLVHELSQVEALDVVPRNGVKPFRDHPVPFDSLVAQLRVGSVVEGSVQRSGDSVRVTVQLIDANSQAHLESRVIVHPVSELFALEDTLAGEVSGFLRRRLGREVRRGETRAETRSDRALALLFQAEEVRDDARRLGGERDPADAGSAGPLLARADSLLALASAADPAWARPVLARGWVALDRAILRGDPAPLSAALDRAEEVLAREPRSAVALELRGAALFTRVVMARRGETVEPTLDGAERSLRAAVAAEPSLATAWSRLAQLLRLRGRLAEADLAARRALAEDAYLDDADDVLHQLFSSALMRTSLGEAGALCGEGARRFPADWRFHECRLTLMREDRAAPPDPALAWHLVAELQRLDPPARARAEGRAYSPVYRQAVAASVLARAGRNDSARAVLARARREVGSDPELRLSLAYDEAYVRLLLGERGEALRLLDELVRARPALRPFLARDPLFRGLLTDGGGGPGSPEGGGR